MAIKEELAKIGDMSKANMEAALKKINYCNDEFPVLSFAYALYCDPVFSKLAHKLWMQSVKAAIPAKDEKEEYGHESVAAALATPNIYDGYLDNYKRNRKREFPSKALKLITVEVAAKGPRYPTGILYSPKTAQAKELVDDYLLKELTGNAPKADSKAPEQKQTHKASVDPTKPVLSCLAMIFVNETPPEKFTKDAEDFLWDLELREEERQALIAFKKRGAKYLNEDEAKVFADALVDEFCRAPCVW
jgi:hypothetical protein